MDELDLKVLVTLFVERIRSEPEESSNLHALLSIYPIARCSEEFQFYQQSLRDHFATNRALIVVGLRFSNPYPQDVSLHRGKSEAVANRSSKSNHDVRRHFALN